MYIFVSLLIRVFISFLTVITNKRLHHQFLNNQTRPATVAIIITSMMVIITIMIIKWIVRGGSVLLLKGPMKRTHGSNY